MRKKTQWHPAFCSAIKLELKASKQYLDYQNEYNLNTKPIQIDLLVIKKPKDATIENEIGKFFKGHNIMEYKSPRAGMNVDTYFKTLAYAYLYKASGSEVDEIKYDDLTISLVRDTKPIKLFKWFRANAYELSNDCNGIYLVNKAGYPATQVIVTKELDKTNHIWLTALTNNLKKEDVERLVYNIENLHSKDEKDFADSVLQLSIKENTKTFDMAKEGVKMCEALVELMKPEMDAAMKEAKREAMIEGRMEGKLEGRIEGREEERRQMNTLIIKLNAAGRIEELIDAAQNEELRQKLFKEFGIE